MITLDPGWLRELGLEARVARTSRSVIVRRALEAWRQARLESELVRGYQAMAAEDRRTAAANLEAGIETLD